jgi:hypothetical protein
MEANMQGQKLIEENPDFLIVLPIWFSLMWRSFLWAILGVAGMLAGLFAFSALLKVIGLTMAFIRPFIFTLAFIFLFVILMWAFYKAFLATIRKSYGGHQLVVLDTVQETVDAAPSGKFCFQLWLAMFWRNFLWTLICIIPFAIIVSVLGWVFSGVFGPEASVMIVSVLNFVGTIVIPIIVFCKVFKKILGLDFSGSQLLLMTPHGTSQLKG